MLRTEDQPTLADYAYASARDAEKAGKEALRRIERMEKILLSVAIGDSPHIKELAAEVLKREQEAYAAKHRKPMTLDAFLKEAYSLDAISHLMESANGR